MTKINTVLFDFDGTIMDTNNVILKSWQHTFRTFEGKERTEEEIIGTFGEPLHLTMEKVLPDVPLEESVAVYREYNYANFLELIDLFPGILELVKELKARGYKTGIVTSRLKNTTGIGLRKYDMEKYFDVIVTCDDTDKHKPHPEPVNIALERLSSKPEEAIMIGDSMFDILCAKNAGVKAALVSWTIAVGEEEKTGENAPDYILENAEDLFGILEE